MFFRAGWKIQQNISFFTRYTPFFNACLWHLDNLPHSIWGYTTLVVNTAIIWRIENNSDVTPYWVWPFLIHWIFTTCTLTHKVLSSSRGVNMQLWGLHHYIWFWALQIMASMPVYRQINIHVVSSIKLSLNYDSLINPRPIEKGAYHKRHGKAVLYLHTCDFTANAKALIFACPVRHLSHDKVIGNWRI